MSRNASVLLGATATPPDIGMERFFTPANLAQYRTLAKKTTTAAERQLILKSLAKEAAAFKHEFAVPLPHSNSAKLFSLPH